MPSQFHLLTTGAAEMEIPTLPVNYDAERAVIGSIILDRDAIIAIAPWLIVEDFYLPQHRAIYAAALNCYSRRVPPDLITIGEVLRQAGDFDGIGGIPGLMRYADTTPTAMHVEYYAQIVRDTALSRAMIEAGSDIASVGFESGLDRAALVHKAQQLLERATNRVQTSALATAEQVSREWGEAFNAGGSVGHSTGLYDLDRQLAGGFHRGELIIAAARPSVGKTALALQVARNIAKREGRVLFCSFEMKRVDLWSRLVAIESGVTLERVRQPEKAEGSDMSRIAEADGNLSQTPLLIDHDFGATIGDVRNRALALQAEKGGIALVVVDYLQLVNTPTGRERNRVLEVGEISRGLKRLSGELDCPVLALSQLSRGVEGRADKIPLLSDLRESGNLEQDGDVVLFLHRPELYGDAQLKGICEIHIAKNRQGPLGKVALVYRPDTGRWMDMAYQAVQGY